MMPGFYWLIDGALAGCSRPGEPPRGQQRPQRGDTWNEAARLEALDRDLAWLCGQGIGAVLSLTETPLDEAALARHELQTLHVPIADMTAPSPEQFMHALAFIDRQRMLGRAVVVHCLVGQGRTGSILAAYRIRAGASPAAALRELRAICPGAVENPAQERALQAFAARQDWIL